MGKNLGLHVQEVFSTIFKCLQEEDRDLSYLFSKFGYGDPTLLSGKGINALYEKSIQHILFKKLLENRKLKVYTERKYERRKFENRKCDLVLHSGNYTLWIEIKVLGYCTDGEYLKWLKPDIEKLKKSGSKGKGVHKYLLVTSTDNEIPDLRAWRKWFKEKFPKIKFNSKCFKYFKTEISDGKRFISGYYGVCLLKVP